MSNARTVIAVARELMATYGADAAATMDARAQENARAGDGEAAAFWARVAQAIRALEAKPVFDQKAFASLFRRAFEATPHPYLLLSPNLRIVNANDAYLAVTTTRRADLIGCNLFDAFPDNPADPDANGTANLGASLARVLDGARPDRMPRQRYDVRRADGLFEERWWEPFNVPVFDDDGRLCLIVHHVEDVTSHLAA